MSPRRSNVNASDPCIICIHKLKNKIPLEHLSEVREGSNECQVGYCIDCIKTPAFKKCYPKFLRGDVACCPVCKIPARLSKACMIAMNEPIECNFDQKSNSWGNTSNTNTPRSNRSSLNRSSLNRSSSNRSNSQPEHEGVLPEYEGVLPDWISDRHYGLLVHEIVLPDGETVELYFDTKWNQNAGRQVIISIDINNPQGNKELHVRYATVDDPRDENYGDKNFFDESLTNEDSDRGRDLQKLQRNNMLPEYVMRYIDDTNDYDIIPVISNQPGGSKRKTLKSASANKKNQVVAAKSKIPKAVVNKKNIVVAAKAKSTIPKASINKKTDVVAPKAKKLNK